MINKVISKLISVPLEKVRLRKKNVLVSISAQIDLESNFEGENIISRKTIVRKTSLGFGSYISANSNIVNCAVGKYTSIGPNVHIIVGQHPTDKFVSTHPAFYSPRPYGGISFVKNQLFEEHKFISKENEIKVKIGNDVWIGDSVKIMEGVEIGDGAIIAAGAIVTKNVPNYTIVGGIPAKFIKKRFGNEEIDFLQKLNWWENDIEWVKQNSYMFTDIEILKRELKL